MPVLRLDCTRCDRRYEPGQILNVCTACGAPLFARYDLERAAKNMRPGHLALREPTLWRYDDVLPVDNDARHAVASRSSRDTAYGT